MRKRGDAAARNGTLFDEGKPGLPSSPNPAGLKFYECRCGLVQTWNNGTCRGCAKSLMGCPVKDEAPLVQDVKRPSAEEVVESVAASPGAVFDAKPAARPPRLALEDDFSALAIRLQAKGIEWKGKPLSLVQLAKWTPEHRRAAAMWLERMADKPAFLENGIIDEEGELDVARRAVAAAEVLVDEDGDVATRDELMKKHASAEKPPRVWAVGAPEAVPCDEVDVTWGEEKYTPIAGSYSTCTVGPFSMTVAVRPGQAREQAFAEAYEMLAMQARSVRTVKLADFVRVLNDVRGKVGQ
jgi:hypothetical protein